MRRLSCAQGAIPPGISGAVPRRHCPSAWIGVKIRGTLGNIDPLNKTPVKRAKNRDKKGLL